MIRDNLTMQVNIDARTCAEVGKAVRDWFTGCFEMLGGDLRDAVLAAAPFPQSAVTTRKPEEPYGEPGAPWAHFIMGKTTRSGTVRRRATAFSVDSYDAFLQDATDLPSSATFLAVTLDEHGYIHGLPFLQIDLYRSETEPDWLFLTAEFPRSLLAAGNAELRVAAWLQSFAERYAPPYGGIDAQFDIYRTKREDDLGLIPDDTVLTSQEKLRGCGWMTICTGQIVDSIGGADELGKSGFFYVVRQLGHGGYLLQVTERLADYDAARANRAAQILEPVTV